MVQRVARDLGSIRSPSRTIKKLRAVLERSGPGLLGRLARVNPAPVFVLGNQKSGTTAIAALVAEAAGVSVTLDIPATHGPPSGKPRKEEASLSELVSKNKLDFSREIVKEPNLTFLYHQLVERFPASKVVFVVRDPRANARSILNRVSLPGDLPRLTRAQVEGVDPRWRPKSKGKGEHYVEMIAARWNLAADTYLENAENMTLIRYEDFCKDKTGEIARLARRVGLEPVNDIFDKVDRQYQRRGDRDVSWPDFFGRDNLARIERICGDRMQRFGYVPGEDLRDQRG
jgi:hypothetical protein